ncbi:hypothetical protein LCGC14_0791140 [marine sediment metagenome]|uniref:Uncharacterized protein n=1 Tax=marine sediment metagenome TaxID=412755 RepID=A0A0F9QC95_9ZZZZ
MKNWIANKIEAVLEKTGFHSMATKWFSFGGRHHWYQPKYLY